MTKQSRKDSKRALLRRMARKSHVSPFYMALINAGLGEKDETMRYLEECYRRPDDWLTGLKVDPAFDNLRTDPRYQDLLRRIGLGEGQNLIGYVSNPTH